MVPARVEAQISLFCPTCSSHWGILSSENLGQERAADGGHHDGIGEEGKGKKTRSGHGEDLL
jgi:hypothetical protein